MELRRSSSKRPLVQGPPFYSRKETPGRQTGMSQKCHCTKPPRGKELVACAPIGK